MSAVVPTCDWPRALRSGFLVASLLLPWTLAVAEPASPLPNEAPAESSSDLEVQRKAVEADSSLAPDIKARAIELLDRALKATRGAQAARRAALEMEEQAKSAPARVKALEGRLQELAAAPAEVTVAASVSHEDLKQMTRGRELELSAARDALRDRANVVSVLAVAGTTLVNEIARSQASLREAVQGAETATEVEQPAPVRDAQGAHLAARQAQIKAELERLRSQQVHQQTLAKLASLERDVAAAEVSWLDVESEALRRTLESRRAAAARRAREMAERTEAAVANLPAEVAQVGERNTALRAELEHVTLSSAEVTERLRTIERISSDLEANLTAMRQRVAAVGPTEAIGRLLRRRLADLPSESQHRQRAASRREAIEEATDRRIDIEERQLDLADTKQAVEALVATIPKEQLEGFEPAWLSDHAKDLLTAKRATIGALHDAYGRYLTKLTKLEANEGQFLSAVALAQVFIRHELLWIRSRPPFATSDLAHAPAALGWLTSRENWLLLIHDAQRLAVETPERTIAFVVLVMTLFAVRSSSAKRLARLGQLSRRIRTDSFRHTAVALLYTALIASGWPLVFALAGWLLSSDPTVAPFSAAVGLGLLIAGKQLIVYTGLYWVVHPEGLAQRHFRWPERVRTAVAQELRWITPLFAIAMFLASMSFSINTTQVVLGLGRPAIVVALVGVGVAMWRIFSGQGPVRAHLLSRSPTRLLTKLWSIWFPLLLAIPFALLVAALLGYVYTASQFFGLLVQSLWVLLGLLVLRDVLLRWFSVAERRLRLEAALAHREQELAEREKPDEPDTADHESVEVAVPEIDYRELGQQGRTVIRVGVLLGVALGFWSLWGEFLPALAVFDKVQLPMTRSVLVDGVEQQIPVMLSHLFVSLLVLAGTIFAAQNLSGLLSFTVFQRLETDPGASYAIVTLCQYVIVTLGVVYALSSLGVEWSKLQWLVAALGVGLGFGLQEIVANFISGIILLIERPIRVGDIVSVGGADGTVTRIRIRATSILTWERKELLVPNKMLITSEVLNWTLSDRKTRLFMVIGVAYGSDVQRARELVLQAAAEAEHVLDDPKPSVTFASFDDSSLALELRCYLPSMDNLLITKTAVNEAIYRKFAEAGIVIAFPQRDVHLDVSGPLSVRLERDS